MAQRIRGALAALLLLASTVGLPLVLASTVGNPLRSWPPLSAGQLSDSDVTVVLAAVFYLAWLSFLVPVLVELAATVHSRITRRPRRQLNLPLLGAQQDIARQLISAVLVLLPVTSTTFAAASPAPPVAAVSTRLAAASSSLIPDPSHHHPSGSTDDRGADPAQRRYVIPETGGMRSYWALAEHYLEDGSRWREIWHLNQGRVHDGGIVMDSPRRLCAGWTVLIPTEPSASTDHARHGEEVTVHPGDTLESIAGADGVSWQRVWQDNKNRREPDGARLTTPGLIRPGWTITLPNRQRLDPSAPGHIRVHPRPVPSAPRSAPRRDDPRPAAPPDASAPSVAVSRPSPGAPDDTTSAPQSAPPPTSAPGDHTAPGHEHHELEVLLLVGLAATAAVGALDRARRIAQRRRRVGHRFLPPPPDLVNVEAQVRRDARHAQPTIAAIGLATALTGEHPVTVRTVVARTDGAVDLHLAEPVPGAPAPFTEITCGWRLPADASAFAFAVDELDDPCPALIPVGTTIDGQVLVNLAAAGPVSIAGDPDTVDAYLRQLIEALPGSPWSQRVWLHLPPRLAEHITASERLIIEDSLRPRPPTHHPHDTTEPEEPGWRTTPVHLYLGWNGDADITPVVRAAHDPDRYVHIIISGASASTATWILDGDQLTLPDLTEPVTITVADPTAPDASDLLHFIATAPDVPLDDPRLPDRTMPPSVTVLASDDATQDPSPSADAAPRLLLLGPVELTSAGRSTRTQALNLLTFLALHPRGVDRHQLRAALWPDQAPSLQTMRNRIREARAFADGGITDGPFWRLADTLTTDWQDFTTLAAGGADEQRQALRLIRGRPFTDLDDADWIDLEGFRSEVEAAIVDLALTVSERDLADESYPAALAAARAGLHASRYEERLHRVAIRAALAQGLNGLAGTLRNEMVTALDLDIEPDEQMQPETLAVLREVRDRRPASGNATRRQESRA